MEALAEDGAPAEEIAEAQEGFEAFASVLVTMREAKARTSEVRKQRGYGNSSGPPDKSKTTCFDCGLIGHWTGDAECKRPGAGAFKPPSKFGKGAGKGASGKSDRRGKGAGKGAREVRVVEHIGVDHDDHEAFAAERPRKLSLSSLVPANEKSVMMTLSDAVDYGPADTSGTCTRCSTQTTEDCGGCGKPLCAVCAQYLVCDCHKIVELRFDCDKADKKTADRSPVALAPLSITEVSTTGAGVGPDSVGTSTDRGFRGKPCTGGVRSIGRATPTSLARDWTAMAVSSETHVVLSAEAKAVLGPLPGALDTCCNRTVGDIKDIHARVAACKALGWDSFIRGEVEHEWFRFGGGERLLSTTRWRLPGYTGTGDPFLYWTSAVNSPGIGQLLGKDVSKGLGFVLNQETDQLS